MSLAFHSDILHSFTTYKTPSPWDLIINKVLPIVKMIKVVYKLSTNLEGNIDSLSSYYPNQSRACQKLHRDRNSILLYYKAMIMHSYRPRNNLHEGGDNNSITFGESSAGSDRRGLNNFPSH